MPAGRNLCGTVLDARTGRRYEGATVRLQREGGEPAFRSSDDDGDFEFDLGDEARWPAGKYTLTAFHPASRLGETSKEVVLETGKEPAFQKIEMVPDQERSDLAGWIFLTVLLGLLAFVGIQYFTLHKSYPSRTLPLDESVVALVSLAQTQAQTVTLGAQSPVSATVAAADTVFTTLREKPEQTLISPEKGQMIAGLFAEARAAIAAADRPALQTVLKGLYQGLQQPPIYFWQTDPWRLLEILLWAFAATLIRLIINTGAYLYQRDFHWRAIPSRVALLATAPVIAVLIAFVLSLVSISITLSDVTLKLDMDTVTISIVVAALIGLAPWEAWRFLRKLADVFFGKLAELIPGKEAGAPPPSGPAPKAEPGEPKEPEPTPETPREAPPPGPAPEPPQPRSAPRRRGPSEDLSLQDSDRV